MAAAASGKRPDSSSSLCGTSPRHLCARLAGTGMRRLPNRRWQVETCSLPSRFSKAGNWPPSIAIQAGKRQCPKKTCRSFIGSPYKAMRKPSTKTKPPQKIKRDRLRRAYEKRSEGGGVMRDRISTERLLEMLMRSHLRFNRHLLAVEPPSWLNSGGGSQSDEVALPTRSYGPARGIRGKGNPLP